VNDRPEVIPNRRVDVMVTDLEGRPRRSTTYTGVIRVRPSPVTYVRGSATMLWESGNTAHPVAVLLPDGLPYLAAALDDAYLAPELAIQGMHGDAYVETVSARFAPDPREQPVAWVELAFRFVGRPQTSFSYRVTAIVPPEAVPPPQ